MNINDAYPSKYLKESDLQGKTVNVVMTHIEIEEVGTDRKPVVYFQNKQKGLMLNMINSKTIASAYGPETNGWTGKSIQLYPTMTEFKGETVPCIRIRIAPTMQAPPPQQEQMPSFQQPPKPVGQPQSTAVAHPESEADFNDEIPPGRVDQEGRTLPDEIPF